MFVNINGVHNSNLIFIHVVVSIVLEIYHKFIEVDTLECDCFEMCGPYVSDT